MRLVVVVDVDGDNPERSPDEWAKAILREEMATVYGVRFVRSEWEPERGKQ